MTADRNVLQVAESEAEQNALLHPFIHFPFAVDFFGGAHLALVQEKFELTEHLQRPIGIGARQLLVVESLDIVLQGHHDRSSWS